MPSFSCTVEKSIAQALRLDRYVSENLHLLSRSQIKSRKLSAQVNGKAVKISKLLTGGEKLELSWMEEEPCFLVPEDLPLDVIYEDQRVIVINKAQGMVVHPGAGNRQGTLANALLYRRLYSCKTPAAQASLSAGQRPGIVHRLDKDTSGLIIAAWDDEAHLFLSEQFKERKVRKSYAAIVQGCPKENSGCIEKRIVRSSSDRKTFTVADNKGRMSVTYFKLVRNYGNYSLLLLRPKTGRTHQIRVHLKYLGNPILGDSIYGRLDPYNKKATLMLHAKSLSLILPGQKNIKTFRTHLPERFLETINAFKTSFK